MAFGSDVDVEFDVQVDVIIDDVVGIFVYIAFDVDDGLDFDFDVIDHVCIIVGIVCDI